MSFRHSLSARRPALIAFAFICSVSLFGAGPLANATTVTTYQFHGTTVRAVETSYSEDGCVETFTYVEADKSLVYYAHGVYDYCQDIVYESADGTATPDDLTVKGDLSTARLVASIPLYSYVAEAPGEVIDLDLAFTATGPRQREKQSFHRGIPGVMQFVFNGHTTRRSATTTGSLETDDAQISRRGYVTVQVDHD